VTDSELAARERVHDRSVTGSIVGEHALDRDTVAAIEGESAPKEACGCGCLFVGQDLGVREASESSTATWTYSQPILLRLWPFRSL
jgi:hypothetical protein